MSEFYVPIPEPGLSADVVFMGEVAVKTARSGLDEASALQAAEKLRLYVAQLEGESVQVAKVQDVSVIKLDPADYRVQHTMDVVPGKSVAQIRDASRQQIVTDMVGQVCSMSTLPDSDTLRTPLDSVTRNWHLRKDGTPVLIDVYPSLARNEQGAINFGDIPSNYPHYERYFGTKSGVVARMLYSAIVPDFSTCGPKQQAKNLLHRVDNWCYDTLPHDIDRNVSSGIRSQLRLRFAPFLAGTTLRKLRSQIQEIRRPEVAFEVEWTTY